MFISLLVITFLDDFLKLLPRIWNQHQSICVLLSLLNFLIEGNYYQLLETWSWMLQKRLQKGADVGGGGSRIFAIYYMDLMTIVWWFRPGRILYT
jgi:hypothetical protein